MLLNYKTKYIDKCVNLLLEVFTSPPFNYEGLNKRNIFKYLTDLANTPNFIGMLYFEEGKLLGFCFGTLNNYFFSNMYEIKEIAVSLNYQGKGLGSKMLELIEKELRAKGVAIITLSTNREIEAFKFYKKNGFSVSENAVHLNKYIK